MYQQNNGFQLNFHPQWQQQQQQLQHQQILHHHEQLNQANNLLYNHQSSQISSNASSDKSSTEDISSKRKQSLERNRLAAYRCRERKKNEQQRMIDQADFLSVQNESLNIMVNDLRNEVIALRELLLAHDSCNCEGVQSFIQRTSSTI